MSIKTRPAVPPLPRLKVKNVASKQQAHPCVIIMSQMLNCWASYGEGNASCTSLELDLKNCMASGIKAPLAPKSKINSDANRLLRKIHKKVD
ncbi:mitochondrial 37S ribosomal protein YmS-T [Martiniozyma asiatica (nom. inval.)]|nr:mitochondrial 37S ribosomal protein YmS-T [Martiniozyma asiatica]